MMRLKKSGMIREVETQAEADYYANIGYEVISNDEDDPDEGGADDGSGAKKPSRGKGAKVPE